MLDQFFYVSNLCCFPQFSRAYYHILYLLWSSPWTAHRLTASHLALLYSVVSKALSTLSSLYCLSILYQYFLSYICCCDPRLPYFSCSAHPTLLVQPSSLFQLVDDLVYHYIIGIILPTYVHSVQVSFFSVCFSSSLSPMKDRHERFAFSKDSKITSHGIQRWKLFSSFCSGAHSFIGDSRRPLSRNKGS